MSSESFTSTHSIDTNLITLSRHIVSEQKKHKDAHGDFTLLVTSIQVACKFISSQVRHAGLVNMTGLAGTTNVQGEAVKKLDVLSNEIFINSLKSSGTVGVMVSEENENEIIIQEVSPTSSYRYCVVFDPLDGSSNIDAGVSIGSIFGIYLRKSGTPSVADALRPGNEMVAAGYAMYGTYTALVLSTGCGTHGYTLDPSIGEFILTHPYIKIPTRGKIYSVNEGNASFWDKACTEYFYNLKNPSDLTIHKTPYSARYVGSMVSDVHRTLLYGGIFAYPGDRKSPKGKLRLLYECFPMAFITENAGGKATTGTRRILDILPDSIHQRSPIILGSYEDVEDFEKFYQKTLC